MARIKGLSAADHALVSEAVTRAEGGTDGEIVTIVTRQSDRYQDVPLHYAVLAMLVAAAAAWLFPDQFARALDWFNNGWGHERAPGELVAALIIVQALLFLLVRYLVAWRPLKMALTPRSTKARRVRRRAVEYFKVGAERRTKARVGVLLYLSLDEHIAEIVADEAIHSRVPAERWGDAMAALIVHVRKGHAGEGMAAAVAAIGAIIGEHFPKTSADTNELPDRLIEL